MKNWKSGNLCLFFWELQPAEVRFWVKGEWYLPEVLRILLQPRVQIVLLLFPPGPTVMCDSISWKQWDISANIWEISLLFWSRYQDIPEIIFCRGSQVKAKDLKLGTGFNFVSEFADKKGEEICASRLSKIVLGKDQFWAQIVQNWSLPLIQD